MKLLYKSDLQNIRNWKFRPASYYIEDLGNKVPKAPNTWCLMFRYFLGTFNDSIFRL